MNAATPSYPAVVIGCGFMGSLFNESPSYDPRHTHAASYKSHKKIKLAGLCDSNAERAKEAGRYWDTPFYHQAEKMLGEIKPAFVSIASPTETHGEMLKLALRTPSVRAVLCEKPITTDTEESIRIVRGFREKGIFLGINYSRRYNKGFNKVKDMIDKGALGKLQTAHVIYQNGILNNGSHFIDLLRYLVGNITAIRAVADARADYQSNLTGVLEFQNGTNAVLQGTTPEGAAFAEIDLIGTKGRIRTEQCGHLIFHYDLAPSPLFPGYNDFINCENISEGITDNTYNAIQDLLECVEGMRPAPRCTGEDAIRDLKIVDALVRSARTDARVEIN